MNENNIFESIHSKIQKTQPWSFIIPGEPIPLKRPRFGHKKVFDSQKTPKLLTGITLKGQMDSQPLTGPLHIDFIFFMPIPKTKRKKISPGQPHTFRPDVDNIVKFYLDCSNSIIFHDDAQVCSMRAIKLYNEQPRTIMKVYKL